MNILKMIALAVAILSAAQAFADAPKQLSPTEQKAAAAAVVAQVTKEAVAMERAMKRAAEKAAWDSKTVTEAMQIRLQAVVDAAQYGGGTVASYAGGFDSKAVEYGLVVPVTAAADGLRAVANASAAYAAEAYNNEVKETAQAPTPAPAPETKK